MNLKKLISLFVSIIFIGSCADYKTNKTSQLKERKYYSSKGFALIYDDDLYSNKLLIKKLIMKKL